MKKLLITAGAFLLFVPAVFASTSNITTGQNITIKNVNVRVAPSANAKRIDHLKKDQVVNVKRIVGNWCEIELKKYKHAYVNCTLLKDANVAELGQTKIVPPNPLQGIPVSKTTEGNWAIGSPNAKVTIEEFGDLQCPACRRFISEAFLHILTDYIATGKVRFIYYNFPLKIHDQARDAAIANMCAGDQDKYWKMHILLLAGQQDWSKNSESTKIFTDFAKDLDLNLNSFNKCFSGNTKQGQIYKDLAEGAKRNIYAVPTFYINGQELVGAMPYEDFKTMIDAALSQAQ